MAEQIIFQPTLTG